jgi:hypothetical protein
MTLSETLSQVRSQEGIAEVGKNQSAVALKVNTLVLTEKQIGMQEQDFDEHSRPLITALGDEVEHLKKTEPLAYQELALKSRAFEDLIAFATRAFVWQEGLYSVRIELRIVGVKQPTFQRFCFKLNTLEVSRLRQNLKEVERYVRDFIRPPADGQSAPYRWNWTYPLVEESRLPSKTA